MRNFFSTVLLPLFAFFAGSFQGCNEPPGAMPVSVDRPNILIILADDMGYSDIGGFGAEVIRTPSLDRLAEEGLRLTRFYNSARCCPSRASLLTGLYPHRAGMGSMADQEIRLKGYQGHLSDDAVTIAQVLKEAGYDTYTSGKWHVGEEQAHWPLSKGFDHCFSFINGASSYFTNLPYRNSEWRWSDGKLYTVDDREIFTYPTDSLVYSTDLYTDRALGYVNRSHETGNPFFLYLAYTAPHWPLHALPEDIQRYRGRFSMGWDSLRVLRMENLIARGILGPETRLSDRDPSVPAWDSLTENEKTHYESLMEVYAAMIDRMDQNIGRILDQLEKNGQLARTVVFFLSDNGASRAEMIPFLHERFSTEAVPGAPESFTGYGPGWANASNTPFRQFKAQVHEGGIATPFIAWNPDLIHGNRIDHTPAHLVDLMATCVYLSGAAYPKVRRGVAVPPMAGVDLSPLFTGGTVDRQAPLFFEHHGCEAITRDPHKLVRLKGHPWELYDMRSDRTEMKDLIPDAEEPLISELLDLYYSWCSLQGVMPHDIVQKRTILPAK